MSTRPPAARAAFLGACQPAMQPCRHAGRGFGPTSPRSALPLPLKLITRCQEAPAPPRPAPPRSPLPERSQQALVVAELKGASGEEVGSEVLALEERLSAAQLVLTPSAVVALDEAGTKVCTAALSGGLRKNAFFRARG